jgi:hypothetical protein
MFRQRQEDCSDREAGEDVQIAHEDSDEGSLKHSFPGLVVFTTSKKII